MASSDIPLVDITPAVPRERAVEAAVSGRPELAQAWALIGLLDEVAQIGRDLRHAQRAARRG